ncbi:cytokine receptor family member B12 [Hoplias malabaricus]|uniref:cytokine receptor family member B12 n=1 Tax=Hoplias malabaricus TaxID=27720 RepID=UPI0034630D65
MLFVPAYVLMLLLTYLQRTKGALFPPFNLSVDLLDFQTTVHWLPGPGNPSETRYSVEFKDIKHYLKPDWNCSADCINITSTQCSLNLDELFTDYFVRVRAEWKEERSDWASLPRTFQLYKDSQLSPPNIRIFSDSHSIQVHLSHQVQSVWNLSLRFSVDLFQVSPDHKVQHIGESTTTGFLNFAHLPHGYSYCVNASAFYTQMSQHQYLNATKCTFLDHDRRGFPHIVGVGVGVVALILMIVPMGYILRTKICYTKPGHSIFPKSLQIRGGNAVFLTMNPEETDVLPVSVTGYLRPVEPAYEMDEDNAPHVYIEKVLFARTDIMPGSRDELQEALEMELQDEMHQTEKIKPYTSALYTASVNMEEPRENLMQEKHLSPDIYNTFTNKNISHPDFDEKEMPKTENQHQLYTTCHLLELSESSEDEIDSVCNDHSLGSSYEPRLDPHLAQLWCQS